MQIEHKYNLTRFAKELGIGRRTLYRWIEEKRIDAPKKTPDGKSYYTNNDLAKYLEYVILSNRPSNERD